MSERIDLEDAKRRWGACPTIGRIIAELEQARGDVAAWKSTAHDMDQQRGALITELEQTRADLAAAEEQNRWWEANSRACVGDESEITMAHRATAAERELAAVRKLISEHLAVCGPGGQDIARTLSLRESRKALRAALQSAPVTTDARDAVNSEQQGTELRLLRNIESMAKGVRQCLERAKSTPQHLGEQLIADRLWYERRLESSFQEWKDFNAALQSTGREGEGSGEVDPLCICHHPKSEHDVHSEDSVVGNVGCLHIFGRTPDRAGFCECDMFIHSQSGGRLTVKKHGSTPRESGE